MFRPGRGRAARQNARLFDRMTAAPLDNPQGLATFHGRRRAGLAWLALLALLGNALLPAVLSIFVSSAPGRDTPICGQWSGDAPGKAKPGLLVQHCPLCTVPVAHLPRPPRIMVPGQVTDRNQVQPLTTVSVHPTRHGRVQARAPPSLA
jgi:hypothetical protein